MRLLLVFITIIALLGCRAGFRLDVEDLQKFAQNQSVDSAAHWVSPNFVLLPGSTEAEFIRLMSFPDGLSSSTKPSAYQLSPAEMPESLERSEELGGLKAYEIKAERSDLKSLLRGEVIIGAWDGKKLTHMHYVQTARVIDALYTSGENDANEAADYGARISSGSVGFALWAPTAQNVALRTYDSSFLPQADLPMELDETSGVWRASLPLTSQPLYYRYEVKVFSPETKKVETFEVSDPYSLGLSANSEYSLVVDLDDPETQPKSWNEVSTTLEKPGSNTVIYALHLGAFSGGNGYSAFADPGSAPMKHLTALSQAGLTTIRLAPANDFAGVNEIAFERVSLSSAVSHVCALIINQMNICQNPNIDKSASLISVFESFDPSTTEAADLMSTIRNVDDYDLGNNPIHYGVPEGSYANNADGITRILEFRQMVAGLTRLGLSVTMDVNFERAAEQSSLNKIVPGYYFKRDPVSGNILTEADDKLTARDNAMMQKLMKDSIKVWKEDYKLERINTDTAYPQNGLLLWDELQDTMASDLSENDRARIQLQALTKTLLEDETPTIQMGDELLRSNVGNWDHKVDFDNTSNDAAKSTFETFKNFIQIRQSSPLFSVARTEDNQARLSLQNEGRDISVMVFDDGFSDTSLADLDPGISQIVIVSNKSAERQFFEIEKAGRLRLHAAQITGSDPIVKHSQIRQDGVLVPAYTTAVFVRPE